MPFFQFLRIHSTIFVTETCSCLAYWKVYSATKNKLDWQPGEGLKAEWLLSGGDESARLRPAKPRTTGIFTVWTNNAGLFTLHPVLYCVVHLAPCAVLCCSHTWYKCPISKLTSRRERRRFSLASQFNEVGNYSLIFWSCQQAI